MSYIVVGMIVGNEEMYIRHSVGAIYNHVDEFVIVTSSTDKTISFLKELDVDRKITLIPRDWDNDYSAARNTYLDYIKKNIYPKHRSDLYYFRVDSDEVYFDGRLSTLRDSIDDSPDAEAFRVNFFTFDSSHYQLDATNPTESRANIFKFTPTLCYVNGLHEMPCDKTPGGYRVRYADIMSDRLNGVVYLDGYWYCHYAWCSPERCEKKARNYTEHYIKDGKETLERLNTITASKDSWWWHRGEKNKVFAGKYPEIHEKYGYFEGQLEHRGDADSVKISAFTIIKNAIKFDYPVIEAIKSVLPIVDEFIVNVGVPCEDGTLNLLHKVFDGIDKVKIFESKWEGKDQGTAFLRNQTNIAKDKCKNEWVLYVQSDEVYHEDDLQKMVDFVKTYDSRKDILGARFNWKHFDGSLDKYNPDGYPQEVRLFRKDKLTSFGDAQSFYTIINGQQVAIMNLPENTVPTDVTCFHYSYVRDRSKLLKKVRDFDGYYHSPEELKKMDSFNEKRHTDGKYNHGDRKGHKDYAGIHPSVMYPRIRKFERENPDMCVVTAKFKEA